MDDRCESCLIELGEFDPPMRRCEKCDSPICAICYRKSGGHCRHCIKESLDLLYG